MAWIAAYAFPGLIGLREDMSDGPARAGGLCGATNDEEDVRMSTGPGFALRSRARLICCIMAGALLVFALGASSADAMKAKKPKHFFYLALGDSISYGYSLVKFDQNLTAECSGHPESGTCEPPSAFEPGLENYVFGKEIKKGAAIKPSKKETTLNLSCPGETSSGLIGHNVSFGGGAGAEFNPCGWHNTSHFRRHFEYGSVSQLEAAAGLITGNPEGQAAAVNLVSINIGSNDELHVLGLCRSKAYREGKFGPGTTEAECVEKEAPALFGKILTNIGHVIGVLRGAGYTGDVVVLGFYNPFGILVHSTDVLQAALNHELEEVVKGGGYGPGVKVANPFGTINAGGVGAPAEKSALEANTEFYSPMAIADELANVTASEELHHSPNLAEVTGFEEAFGSGCVEGVSVRPKFEDSKCETANPSGKFQKEVPDLAEAILEQEIEGEPNLAIVTFAQEHNGSPNLAEVEAFQEAHGSPNLAETEAFEEAHGTPNLAEVTANAEANGVCGPKLASPTGRFKDANCSEEEPLNKGEYERVKPNLKEATEAHEAEAHAGYIAACEGKGHNLAECEVAWLSEGKAEYEATVKAAFDHEVKVAFDEAVEAGFDAAVKAGFDAAVKTAFDEGIHNLYRAKVRFAFDKQVREGFEAAGSPGDIHPSKAGYKVLGNLVKANK
jgi:hypothetical protein